MTRYARQIRRNGARWLFRAAFAVGMAVPVARAQDSLPSLTVRGLIDARLIAPDDTPSWENGGLGKTRYGGEPDVIARLAEASLILQPRLTWDLSGFVHLSTNTQQRNAIDLIEGFLSYRPAATGSFGLRARAGTYFPPISLENTGLAWTSPYSVTSSAINSWIGEELRSTGAEVTVFHQDENVTLSLIGSAFGYNDPAGALLAWRGWAIHDRKAGVLDRLSLPRVRIVRPGARLQRQARFHQPFKELDERISYYVAGRAEHGEWGEARALYYNNPGDDLELQDGQWPWNAEFVALGGKTLLPGDVDLIAQFIKGNTTVVTVPGAASPIVHVGYMSGFVLASHEWDRHRLSLRLEYFATDDKDVLFPDNNNEWGNAVTAAYVFRPAENQRLTLEVLRVHSTRPERALGFGQPRSETETEIQASYRFFF
jgi:hypothetical protein